MRPRRVKPAKELLLRLGLTQGRQKRLSRRLALDFGDYNYKIICNDKSGNFAYEDIKFTVTKDIKPPQFINIYKEGNELTLEFNEKVSCEYGFTKFNYGSGQLINQDSETQGFIFEENKIYYLNCKDQFDNLMREIRIIP